MYIISQDRDIIFTLQDKGLLKSTIYAEDVEIDGKYYGTNIFGTNLLKTYMLGTYEENEAAQVIAEIYRLLKAGEKYYSMPVPSLDLDDMGVNI
jgi:DNA modification methylase